MENNQTIFNDEKEIDLLALVKYLLSKIIYIILATLVFAIGAFFITKVFVSPKYQSSIKFYVYNKENPSSYGGSTSSSDLQASSYLAESYQELLDSNLVYDSVREQLEKNTGYIMTRSGIKGSSSIKIGETQTVSIVITTSNPDLSYNIAKAFEEISPTKILEITKVGGIVVLNKAELPTTASSPNVFKNVAIGAMIGFVLCCGVLFIMMISDKRIITKSDVESSCNLSVLGMVPQFDKNGDTGEKYKSWKIKKIGGGESR